MTKRIQGKRPLSKKKLADLAGVSVATLNREHRLGRIQWARDWSDSRGLVRIQVAEAKRWLKERNAKRKRGICK